MSISIIEQEVREELKVSYQAPGFPLDRDLYPIELRSDQKRSVLDSIIAKESRRSRLEILKKYPAKDKLRSVCREIIVNEVWSGVLSPDQEEQKYYFLKDGIFGEKQTDKDGKDRLVVFHSNRRRDCPCCAERYQEGKALERSKKVNAVMQANEVRYLEKYRFTFPDFIRSQIKDEKEAQFWRDQINKRLQKFYGCLMKRTGGYQEGSVWIEIDTHWYSSQEGWKESLHFHPSVIPLQVDGERVKNVEQGRRSKQALKQLRRDWAEDVKEGAKKRGYERVEDIPDELVVNYTPVDREKNLREKGYPGFNFRYDMRSAAYDLEKAVKGVDLENKIVILFFSNKIKGYTYYAIWPLAEYAKELRKRLQIKNTHTGYGWGTRYRKQAPVLGIDISEEKDLFELDPGLTVRVEYKRYYKGKWNKEKRRVEVVKRMFFRELDKPDRPGPWQEVDPWAVHGEQSWTAAKKKYSYKARSPDRRA